MSARAPVVELLWWRGCPSADDALERLRTEMSAVGLERDAVVVREVDTQAAAEREEFVGSPTIRIDGRDIQPPGEEPLGLTCRVYRLRDGRVSALPDASDIREALEQAIEGAKR